MRFILLVAILFFTNNGFTQSWVPTPIADMPMATTNNAVCEARANGLAFMFSFGGRDSTKVYTGIHQECFRYNVSTNTWDMIDPLPDTLGKIAAAASFVKDKIYILGGYHVYSNGSELSSSRVHIYNPNTNMYESDGAPIPVPTDDHAQIVWRDSLIFLIGGWSNTANIENVQIYNPSANSWQAATSLPNNNQYKFFGAQATLLGDTIFYYGGAAMGFNFPAFPAMRMGVIDSNNPTVINWLPVEFNNGHPLYRSIGITNPNNELTFLGGSAQTYNYNGQAYAGGLGVEPSDKQVIYNPITQQFRSDTSQSYPMDLRGLAHVSPEVKYICGGMEANQLVSDKAYKLEYMAPLHTADWLKRLDIKVFPNPAKKILNIELDNLVSPIEYRLSNIQGQLILKGKITHVLKQINLEGLSPGKYFLILSDNKHKAATPIIIH